MKRDFLKWGVTGMELSKGIDIIFRSAEEAPSQYAIEHFCRALKAKGVSCREIRHYSEADEAPVLVIGTAGDRRIQLLLEQNQVDYSHRESVFYQWCRVYGRQVLLIAGSDANGLMYALLELVERIEDRGAEALASVENTVERPENAVRCMDRYLLGPLDDEWFKSEDFWNFFLGRLAQNRYNRFCLIMGYDTPYMSPPYPYFVPVSGYAQVVVKGLTDAARDENLRLLRKIGELCHRHGQKFFLATWQQRATRLGQESEVSGLDQIDMMQYCHDGILSLLHACPEIDGVQFRVNHESGVGSQITAEDFWNHCVDAVAEVAQKTGRKLILDLRAKGLSDGMIDHAFSTGLHVEVATKFWCEHAAMPYHLTVMRTEELTQLDNLNFSRRYSYGDMLRKPRYYDVIFRLWNYGSTNLFLWGDADYVRRFSRACAWGGGYGYQVNNPLALKGGCSSRQEGSWHTFKDASLRSGSWEEERFWMWYTLFGRLGYRSDADADIWMRGFRKAFGVRSAPVLEKALRYGSRIIPTITAFHMPMHPSLTYWPEMSTGWGLFGESNAVPKHRSVSYGRSEPSDTGLFYGIDEYAAAMERNDFCGKYSPLQVSDWLTEDAQEALEALCLADQIGENEQNPEYLALKTDIRMLSLLAYYHTQKIRAALSLERWKLNGERTYLHDAYCYHICSKKYWMELSDLGKRAYHHDLEFSSGNTMTRHGTWEDLLPEINTDEERLLELLGGDAPKEPVHTYCTEQIPKEYYALSIELPETHPERTPLVIHVRPLYPISVPIMLHYRHTNQMEGAFCTLPLQREESGYIGVIPPEYLTAEWDLMLYISINHRGSAFIFPGINHPQFDFPYLTVRIASAREIN